MQFARHIGMGLTFVLGSRGEKWKGGTDDKINLLSLPLCCSVIQVCLGAAWQQIPSPDLFRLNTRKFGTQPIVWMIRMRKMKRLVIVNILR